MVIETMPILVNILCIFGISGTVPTCGTVYVPTYGTGQSIYTYIYIYILVYVKIYNDCDNTRNTNNNPNNINCKNMNANPIYGNGCYRLLILVATVI